MLRVFTCILIPEEIKNSILELQEKLKKIDIKAKFVEKENLHITLTFLGAIREEQLEEIKIGLEKAAEGMKDFHVKIGNLKMIPSEDYVKVIGIHVKDENNILPGLIKSISSKIDGDYHLETKITLCRVKNVGNKQSLKNFIDENRDVSIGELHVKKISLVKSTLTRSGPIYETIHEVMLR